MDLSVEHGYRYLRILAGNEEPVCQLKLSHKGVHLLLQKQARPGVNPQTETISISGFDDYSRIPDHSDIMKSAHLQDAFFRIRCS
jgi:hypothetical protein